MDDMIWLLLQTHIRANNKETGSAVLDQAVAVLTLLSWGTDSEWGGGLVSRAESLMGVALGWQLEVFANCVLSRQCCWPQVQTKSMNG